jgi:acyl carrier protein
MGIDLLELRFRIEETFGVKVERGLFVAFEDAGIVRCCTVGELYGRLIRTIDSHRVASSQNRDQTPNATCFTDEEIWNELSRLLCDVLAAKPSEITPEARPVEDLGAS